MYTRMETKRLSCINLGDIIFISCFLFLDKSIRVLKIDKCVRDFTLFIRSFTRFLTRKHKLCQRKGHPAITREISGVTSKRSGGKVHND